MSWFSSALQGIGHAVNWVKQNSGTIAQAASTIAQVAGAVGEGEDPAEALFPNFTTATAKVAKVAEHGAKKHLEKVLDSLPAQIKNDPTLEVTVVADPADTTLLWFDPAPLDSKGQPNRGLVRDLGKMLTARSLPTVLPAGPGSGDINALGLDWLDVGLKVGQAIFGNLGAVETFEDGLIQSTRFKIPSGDGSCTIAGCHAYYSIPLGQTGPNSAWHAGLVMHKITTGSYRKLESALNKSLTLTNNVENRSSEPQWLCTMNVQWEDAVSANVVAPKLIQQLQANGQGYVLHYNSVDGMDQQIKIQCPNDATPAQAKGLVRQCIKTAMSDSGMVTPAATAHFLTPDVQLTMSTLVFPTRTTN